MIRRGAPDAARAPRDGWLRLAGDGVTVLAPVGSRAAGRAEEELRRAERIVVELARLLTVSARQRRTAGPVQLVLVDGPAPTEVPGRSGAVREHAAAIATAGLPYPNLPIRLAVPPDGTVEPPTAELVHLLLARWLGPQAVGWPVVVAGLAGLVAGRLDAGPSRAAVEARLRSALAADEAISIGERVVSEGHAALDPAATSFVAFLLDQRGPATLRRFLVGPGPADPARRVEAVYGQSLAALEAAWLDRLAAPSTTGAALLTLLRHLLPLMRPYRLRQLEVLLYMLFELGYGLVLPLAIMTVIDQVIPSGNVLVLFTWAGGLLLGYVLDAMVGLRRAYVNDWVNERLLLDLRLVLFRHLQRLPHQFFADARVGDLMARLFGDLDAVGQALSQLAGVGIYLALRATLTAAALVTLSPRLGALILVVVPVFAGAYLLLRRRMEQASYEYQNLGGEAEAVAQESISAHATIKAFGLEEATTADFRTSLLGLFRASLRLTIVGAMFETSISLAITLGELLVLCVGGYLVMRDELTLGTLVAFIGLLGALFSPIGMLSNVGQTVQKASGALSRVTEVLDEPATIADRPGARPVCEHVGELRFEGVSFEYSPGQPILNDLTLAIPPGGHVAIVGPSGAGKSTLIHLLLRFWDPTHGRITLGGHDLRSLQLASYRDRIGTVLQDTHIFDATIRENIALGRLGVGDEEIVAAARAAQLDEYVRSLPHGYDTEVGERGVRMSGGQRQRLAIARALLRDPQILILDEPTSALDAATERELVATLRRLAQGRTVVSITHRLALAATADRIMVLERGRLVEQGSHSRLLRQDGLYRRLYQEQLGRWLEPARAEGDGRLVPWPIRPDQREQRALG